MLVSMHAGLLMLAKAKCSTKRLRTLKNCQPSTRLIWSQCPQPRWVSRCAWLLPLGCSRHPEANQKSARWTVSIGRPCKACNWVGGGWAAPSIHQPFTGLYHAGQQPPVVVQQVMQPTASAAVALTPHNLCCTSPAVVGYQCFELVQSTCTFATRP